MEKKRIIIGADSAGYTLKEYIKNYLAAKGYGITDMGTDSEASCHYPVFASKVCEGVLEAGGAAYGILICGTGFGMSMCANKYKGIRAELCGDTFSAKMTRRHNDANVLCMGARVIGACLAEDIVDSFLENEFEGGRHKTRVDMMTEIENKQ